MCKYSNSLDRVQLLTRKLFRQVTLFLDWSHLYEHSTAVKVNLWRTILSCFSASVDSFYTIKYNVRILCIFRNVEKPTTKRPETSVVLIVMVSSMSSAFILLPFPTVDQHESGIRGTISWPVTVYITKHYPVNLSNCSDRTSVE